MRAVLCVLGLTLGTVGCSPNGLYVASETVVGVHGRVNTEKTSGFVMIGYDRDFATIIPRSVDLPKAENADAGLTARERGREVMSAMGCSELEVEGIFLTKFVESLATGRAARAYAKALKDGNTDGNFFSCMKNSQQNQGGQQNPAQPQTGGGASS
jgi:hypothetical protein